MSTITLTADTLKGQIKQNNIILIDFWAAWCGPCRMFAPVFETASEQHPDFVFGKVDTETEQDSPRPPGSPRSRRSWLP